ncbi:sigma 54-interacting transcriptional regulator [Treponema pedis]|uniref:sigma 54-interacting transcriptional regulator n=1 Tax=Treponema pedis TaxID=409322 RepID=UPI0003F8D27B
MTVVLNSPAAFQDNLLESELFGYVEGSFTGARKGGKLGLFEYAHGELSFSTKRRE